MESIKDKLNWTIEQKLFHFFEVIDLFYQKTEGKVYIGFSGGKDSTLLVHLCDLWCKIHKVPLFPLVFNNTTNEYKSILDFVKTYGDRVIWLKPKMTFAQVIEKHGYPLVSKETAQYISEAKKTKSAKLRDKRLNGQVKYSKSTGAKYVSGKIPDKWKYLVFEDIDITSKCCDILKKAPVAKFEEETGLFPIIGTTVSESQLRLQSYIKAGGCNDFTKSRLVSRPMSLLTEDDIWYLIDYYQLKVADVYHDQVINGVLVKGEERTGCAYCGFAIQYEDKNNTKFHRLRHREPNRWKSMMDKMGYRYALSKLDISFEDKEKVYKQLEFDLDW